MSPTLLTFLVWYPIRATVRHSTSKQPFCDIASYTNSQHKAWKPHNMDKKSRYLCAIILFWRGKKQRRKNEQHDSVPHVALLFSPAVKTRLHWRNPRRLQSSKLKMLVPPWTLVPAVKERTKGRQCESTGQKECTSLLAMLTEAPIFKGSGQMQQAHWWPLVTVSLSSQKTLKTILSLPAE